LNKSQVNQWKKDGENELPDHHNEEIDLKFYLDLTFQKIKDRKWTALFTCVGKGAGAQHAMDIIPQI